MRASGKSKKILLGILFLVSVSIAAGYSYWSQKKSQEVTYKLLPIKRGDLEVSILSTGTVAPENRVDVKAPVAGRMENIRVNEGDKVKKGQIIASMSSTERAAMLDAARAKGTEEFKTWSNLYLATPIVASISGTIILRNVEPGQTFTTSDAIFTMSDRLTVKAQVDETDISQIKLKQAAQIVLDAYPGKVINAQVDQIAFDAKTINSVTTYIVDVLPGEFPEYMRSGMTANVKFFVESKKNILLVPNEALKVQNGKTILMLKDQEGNPIQREIQIGVTDGKNTEVIEGAEEGDVAMVPEVKLNRDKKGTNPFSPMGGRMPRGRS
ncbi:MAG: efflux RND transporter periplasmic adaptor subunit [Pseudobdellovibrionaceae bacterium]